MRGVQQVIVEEVCVGQDRMNIDDSVNYQQLGQSFRHLMSHGGVRLLER